MKMAMCRWNRMNLREGERSTSGVYIQIQIEKKDQQLGNR